MHRSLPRNAVRTYVFPRDAEVTTGDAEAEERPITVCIRGLDGELLLERSRLDAATTFGSLKKRLPRREGVWRLLIQENQLPDTETLGAKCREDADNEVFAVLVNSTAAIFEQVSMEVREARQELRRASDAWLQEAEKATEERRLEQRAADVRLFEDALAALLPQLVEEVLVHCRRAANEGKSWVSFIKDNLQEHDVWRKFFFRVPCNIRGDPLLRGWYFSTKEPESNDPLQLPEYLMMGGATNTGLMRMVAQKLVPLLKNVHGLTVHAGSYVGVFQISWASVDTCVEQGMHTYASWW